MAENKKIEYKTFSFRLNEKTVKRLRKVKKEKNLSWNIIFKEFVDNCESK